MLTSFISLVFGLIIGYLAQRSRMCFIGGMRDFILVRDTYLLKGLISFLFTAAVLFPIANYLGGDTLGYPWFNRENSQIALEQSRQILGQNPCWIPEEAIVAFKDEIAKANGVTIPGGYIISKVLLVTMMSGLGIGYLSTIANGCPLRQHVLAAAGNQSSRFYLAGFYIGAVIYTYFLSPLLRL